jgi:hypothetical protein
MLIDDDSVGNNSWSRLFGFQAGWWGLAHACNAIVGLITRLGMCCAWLALVQSFSSILGEQ